MLPFKPKRLKALFRQRGVGRLEVKKRGVDIDPEPLRRRLSAAGDAVVALFVTRRQRRVVAIVARRLG